MQRPEPVETPLAPKAIGPYSQAVQAGGWVFCSGQIALTPQGDFKDGSAAEQAVQALDNLAEVLGAAGVSLQEVVKVTLFLTDMADFEAVNAVYERFFAPVKPARSTVAVAALPKGARVEVDALAVKGSAQA